MNTQFLTAFAQATQLPANEADAQWSAYSRQLSDAERSRIEDGGAEQGVLMGLEFAAMFGVPPHADSHPPCT
jgi:hypothetical protein